MGSVKCPACGLVNFVTVDSCRRCGNELVHSAVVPAISAPVAVSTRRGFGRWILWICGVTGIILISCHVSLLLSSDGLTADERQTVMAAVATLDRAGFARESMALQHVVNFRRTDNWWNRYVGHQTAYAATNFPFAVVTLYPTFFKYPVDDIERATILLHESFHLFGSGEEAALRRVWIEKRRLGWTSAGYSHTRVWKNTREWTAGSVPLLFHCGQNGQSDCLE